MNFDELNLPAMYRENYERDLASDVRDARWDVDSWMRGQRTTESRALQAAKARTATACRAKARATVFGDLHLLIDHDTEGMRAKAAELEAEADSALAAANGKVTPRSYEPRCRAEAIREIADRWERGIAARHAETIADWQRTAAEYNA